MNSYWYLGGGLTQIPANADLNTYLTPGNYCCPINTRTVTLKNCPVTNAFVMHVYYANGCSPDGSYNYVNQEITAYIGGGRYLRCYNIGTTNKPTWATYQIQTKEVS